ncbi:ubiquinol-cytochrome c reductase core subunit 1 [Phycomyces blakesleeanus]|uniref:Cytochrome b-c1 complex subunit 2, mitochondrial n=2 Tax=Phycomyces blakesleeanus TaxID=4837 RepID=A0A162PPF8_PHYB8|nr:ubiquinol-cytochrome c reductase core subunit 1 [Phycomyces blakesleeanus NRRL 1555(-)]OAD71686.1 ubiquinol-cytochrome c reductase core subunit 1 [Phycomyces blakesleeanus NRRL 1555(-)]|eukprot:XP_018289726.1 ubiquinol-cytochrome c reductase core subunit 1 [Phycomyces blakesleeanus NRRL 1555(-)]
MLAATRRAIVSTTASAKASYATAAAAQGVQITTAKNGVKVASVEEAGQTAGLSVVVNGGSRLENGHAGVAHFLKNYGFKNNANRTAFRIAREAELAGAVLSSNLTHESIVYSAEFLSEDAEQFAEILADVVQNQKFQEHEFIDIAKQTAAESANAWATPELASLELAHQGAFRTGLGNSVFAKPTSHINNAAVKSYAKQLFVSGNIALVGTGIAHETVEKLAETYFAGLPSGQELKSAATKYYGAEIRTEGSNALAQYVLAFEGAASNSAEFAAAQVLRFALGGDKFVKWSAGSSLLAQASAKFGETTEIKAFNFGYSDAGLFGVQVTAANADATAAVSAAAEQLKAVATNLSGEDFKRAVAQAKFAAVAGLETRLDRLETVGTQALLSGNYTSTSELVAALDKITASEVSKIAEKILKGKATTVALGDLSSLPYADSVSL